MSNVPLDIERPEQLLAYLRIGGRIGPGETPAFRTLAGGVSNRTVLVERTGGEAWVVKQALERLRVATEWLSSPRRIHREAQGLRYLERLAPAGSVPRFLFEDKEHHLLAMEAVPQPHENWKTMLLAGRLEMGLVEQFGRLLGTIHRRSWLERDDTAAAFDDRTFFESLRIEPYYRYTAAQAPAAAGFLAQLISATRARRFTVVHGDYSPKNILVHKGKLVLLDHEVIHFGDPAFDLGFSLTHFLGKANHLPSRREEIFRALRRYWRLYRETLGEVAWANDLESFAVRHTLGCMLARVAGRSPLEYLSPAEREKQRAAALNLMGDVPPDISTLADRVAAEL